MRYIEVLGETFPEDAFDIWDDEDIEDDDAEDSEDE